MKDNSSRSVISLYIECKQENKELEIDNAKGFRGEERVMEYELV